MSDAMRKVTVRVAGERSLQAIRELDEEAVRLRDLVDHATEFTFRPDYGDLNDQFSDDPAGRDSIVLSRRGPARKGGHPDWWAILLHGRWCWSSSEKTFVFEPSPGNRDDAFLAATRFTLDEALNLIPGLLRDVEAERLPELRSMVEARAARTSESGTKDAT